jgi:ferrous iron transport protein B
MIIMFSATFTLGKYPQHWIEMSVGMLSDWLNITMDSGSLKDLLINGIIGGVGDVIVFLPNILILFLFISFMEDSGYMARAVFIMDKLMHKIGLHGKSLIPLIMGFGCNVPAIMATRTIEDRNNKLLTILINPFMSCSARLPVYLLLIGAIFPAHQGIFLLLLYFFGVTIAIGVALLFKQTLFKSESTPFVMELPPYRLPTLRSTLKHMWFKGSYYFKKMGGAILVASVLLWALGYFPRNIENIQPSSDQITELKKSKAFSEKNYLGMLMNFNDSVTSNANKKHESNYESLRLENSYIGWLGKLVEPMLQPLGFNWKMGVSLISGIAVKEIVVSTLGVLHQVEIHNANIHLGLSEKLQNKVYTSGKMKDNWSLAR